LRAKRAHLAGLNKAKTIPQAPPVHLVERLPDIHALLSVASTMAPADVVKTLKGNSSKWINESLGLPCRFEWQEGYGAFSVSCSQIDKIVAYIRNQEEHHRKKSFQQEYLGFLKKHRIAYDERYIWS
jgi:putative transposase